MDIYSLLTFVEFITALLILAIAIFVVPKDKFKVLIIGIILLLIVIEFVKLGLKTKQNPQKQEDKNVFLKLDPLQWDKLVITGKDVLVIENDIHREDKTLYFLNYVYIAKPERIYTLDKVLDSGIYIVDTVPDSLITFVRRELMNSAKVDFIHKGKVIKSFWITESERKNRWYVLEAGSLVPIEVEAKDKVNLVDLFSSDFYDWIDFKPYIPIYGFGIDDIKGGKCAEAIKKDSANFKKYYIQFSLIYFDTFYVNAPKILQEKIRQKIHKNYLLSCKVNYRNLELYFFDDLFILLERGHEYSLGKYKEDYLKVLKRYCKQ